MLNKIFFPYRREWAKQNSIIDKQSAEIFRLKKAVKSNEEEIEILKSELKIKGKNEFELNGTILILKEENDKTNDAIKKLELELENEKIKRKKANTAKGGLSKQINKLKKQISSDQEKYNNVVKGLQKEIKKLKDPTTIQRLRDYERR